MSQDNVLNNILTPTLWEQMIAAETRRLDAIKQANEAKKSFKDCVRCQSAKVHKANWNVCLSCSYC